MSADQYGSMFSTDAVKTLSFLGGAIEDDVTPCDKNYWIGDGVGNGGTTGYYWIQAIAQELGFINAAGTGPAGTWDSLTQRIREGDIFLRDGSLTMLGDIDFETDGAYDIGAVPYPNNTRPGSIWVRNYIVLGDDSGPSTGICYIWLDGTIHPSNYNCIDLLLTDGTGWLLYGDSDNSKGIYFTFSDTTNTNKILALFGNGDGASFMELYNNGRANFGSTTSYLTSAKIYAYESGVTGAFTMLRLACETSWHGSLAGDGPVIEMNARGDGTGVGVKLKCISDASYPSTQNCMFIVEVLNGNAFYVLYNKYVGCGNASPLRQLDSLDASNAQLRLTQTYNTNYCDFKVNSSGQLEITPSGTNVGIGTTSPGNTLTITTTASQSSLYVAHNESSSWAAAIITSKYGQYIESASTAADRLLGIYANSGGTVAFNVYANRNIGIGTASFGSGAVGVLAIVNGTQGAAAADMIQITSEDFAAGSTMVSIQVEGSDTIATGSSSQSGTIAIKYNGSTRHLMYSDAAAA